MNPHITTHGEFTIATFIARQDMRNFGVLIHHTPSNMVLCIDAPSASSILTTAAHLNWNITHLLITHHHWDHVDGMAELKARTNCTIYGCAHPKITPVDHLITAGISFNINGIEIQPIATPGHCPDQIAYYIPSAHCAFVADAIFNLSCGRLLDGTPAKMFETLQRLKQLPAETSLWFGHDYYETNLQFSHAITPNDAAIANYSKSRNPLPCPTTLQDEMAANLFLRAKTVEALTTLRLKRDRF